jgi:SAM-dependent methyltransferase
MELARVQTTTEEPVRMRDSGDIWRRRLLATGYDFAVHCGPVARAGARLLWGYDIGGAWAMIGETGGAAPGTFVLDAPSGGGIALRGLRQGQHVHYVAADIAASMLARARARAGGRRLTGVACVQADLTALPFPGGAFGLCLSYNGLHCLPRPGSAIAEYARVLRPGGELRGTTIVGGAGRWHSAVTWVLRRTRLFGPPFGAGELGAWLAASGFEDVRVRRSGAVASFRGRLPGAPPESDPHTRC